MILNASKKYAMPAEQNFLHPPTERMDVLYVMKSAEKNISLFFLNIERNSKNTARTVEQMAILFFNLSLEGRIP